MNIELRQCYLKMVQAWYISPARPQRFGRIKKKRYPEMSHAACRFAEEDGPDCAGGVTLPAGPSIDHLPDAKETAVAGLPGGRRLALHGRGSRRVAKRGRRRGFGATHSFIARP